ELALDPVEPTARRVQEDAALGFAHLRACVGPDHDVRRRSVHYVRQLLAYTVVVEIDSGDDLQIVLLESAAGDAAADGPEAHQCDFDRQAAPPARFGNLQIPGREEPYSPPISGETSESRPTGAPGFVGNFTWRVASSSGQDGEFPQESRVCGFPPAPASTDNPGGD